MQKFEITNAEGGAAIAVHVQPNAKTNKVRGKDHDIVWIDLAVEAEKTAINEALVGFLSATLNILEEQIAIAGGRSLDKKVVIIMGLTPKEIEIRLFG